MMTVKELIKKLEKCNPNATVYMDSELGPELLGVVFEQKEDPSLLNSVTLCDYTYDFYGKIIE